MRHSVRDGRQNGDDGHLRHALWGILGGPSGQDVGGLVPDRDLGGARQVIAIPVPGAVTRSIFVERQIFVQRMADAHGQAALKLAGHKFRDDLGPALQDRVMRQQFHAAGLGVDCDFDDIGDRRHVVLPDDIAHRRIGDACALDEVEAAGCHQGLALGRRAGAVANGQGVGLEALAAHRRNVELRLRPLCPPTVEDVNGYPGDQAHLVRGHRHPVDGQRRASGGRQGAVDEANLLRRNGGAARAPPQRDRGGVETESQQRVRGLTCRMTDEVDTVRCAHRRGEQRRPARICRELGLFVRRRGVRIVGRDQRHFRPIDDTE